MREEFDALREPTLAELEGMRLLLRGGSVIDWHRLNYKSEKEVLTFLRAQELRLDDASDLARTEAVKQAAMSFLRRKFDFPIPKPVAEASLAELILIASGRGHRQLCACTILKVMHIIHHIEARELSFMLPTSDEEVFHLVEQKLYRVVGAALAKDFPIVEFIGGRKNRDSLYVKLLSKQEVSAAQIYDKLRFRIVLESVEDLIPMLNHLTREVFPFNYVIPCESTNSLVHFTPFCMERPHLAKHLPELQLSLRLEDKDVELLDNQFSSHNYRVVHFVADMPIRLPESMLADAPPAAWALGRVIFVQTEFQIVDAATEKTNELGDASHAAYKERQHRAVMQRLKVGLSGTRAEPGPGQRRDTMLDLSRYVPSDED